MGTDHWAWPDELDALTAAPGNHQLLLENDRVRALLTTIPIGATTPVHAHRWPSVEYVVTAVDFVRRDRDGNVLLDSRPPAADRKRPTSGRARSRRTRSRTSATPSCA